MKCKNWKQVICQRKSVRTHLWLIASGARRLQGENPSACRAPSPPERARSETGGDEHWVLKRREFPGGFFDL